MLLSIRKIIARILPKPILRLYILLRTREDWGSLIAFLFERNSEVSFRQRLSIVRQLFTISLFVYCPHTQRETISFVKTILSLPNHIEGCIVEAGSFKGGGTAKFSIAAKIANMGAPHKG